MGDLSEMKMIIYKAGDADSHKAAGKMLQELPPGEYVLKITKNRPIRSLKQNGYYHFVWQIYATHTGHYVDELKKEFYDKIGFYEFFMDARGKQTKRYKSTADLDDAEMARIINQQAQWGRDEFPSVIVPRREDATYMMWMQAENEYNKTFSGF